VAVAPIRGLTHHLSSRALLVRAATLRRKARGCGCHTAPSPDSIQPSTLHGKVPGARRFWCSLGSSPASPCEPPPLRAAPPSRHR
jgi:hypothetical protein